MTGLFEPQAATAARPELPAPALTRWQPLRLGLVELFHYDSEEFWFRDGHLLLRGNNGTGKSKVLALTLPFLFDAQLSPSRVEPDGDPGKKMAWNLLLGAYDRRIGYAWIEFGRRGEDGHPRYLTLGAGLSASAARPQVDSWFFILDAGAGGPRLGRDLWLASPQRVVLTKERLREAIHPHGQVFDTATQYRRAVDEHLFRLGPTRYAALIDTLVQLRQPQLSKRPNEALLSNALTEALPPLAPDLLGDVADALGRLAEDRRQLDDFEALERAVSRFDQRYRVYAGTQARRQARILRQAQTEFDNASRAVNEAEARLAAAQEGERGAEAEHEQAALSLAGRRARLDTLRSDPAMQDANRLDGAAQDAAARRRALEAAGTALASADERLKRAVEDTRSYARRAADVERARADRRRTAHDLAAEAGISGRYGESTLAALDAEPIIRLSPSAFEAAQLAMRPVIAGRRDEIALIRRRQAELATAEERHAYQRQAHAERREDADGAEARRRQADADVERTAAALVEAWDAHIAGLRQIDVDGQSVLPGLTDWVVVAVGENPARRALQEAQRLASQGFAERRAELGAQVAALDGERQSLDAERHDLESGKDPGPPAPPTRDAGIRDARAGAPLWQLVEFRDGVDMPLQAGLEAALEAAGLLDAWVSPDGRIETLEGGPLHDTSAVSRPRQASSLADWLRPAGGAAVSAAIVERVLAGIACAEQDADDAEAWVAPDGRFRLGALAGAWSKPAASHIGFAAREAARTRRLAAIAERLAALDREQAAVRAQRAALAMAEREADEECRTAPSDDALLRAHLTASQYARELQAARERLEQAGLHYRAAEQALRMARAALAADAGDLRLPEAPDALAAVEATLGRFGETWHRLAQAVSDLRSIVPELRRQEAREAEAEADWGAHVAHLAASRTETEEAEARLQVLREALGVKVEALLKRLADADLAVRDGERAVEAAAKALREAASLRAVAANQADIASSVLQDRTDARALAVGRLQAFAATGLLSAALPDIEMPDLRAAWTIDPALGLARRTEAALAAINDSEEVWARIQRQIGEELTELQRALTALGEQAQAETSDYGLAVSIVYQNQPVPPARLAGRLAEEVASRRDLLSASEREVLENHLQAEIATEVQRLLRAAEQQVEAVNRELHRRPTSTGVRYRLQWLPLSEGAEGAPVGLEAARRRLLNTGADLWSEEDRRVVGAMLQQRIAAERDRADAAGSLLDQLAHALDYRRWHEFRVQRWQDGEWRKLSGPASSGERALGLTVPLFAAVASFYSQSGYAHAPRLVLLDEAFAGIDAAARAHCMALIREFDLDFVMTSESEWACYAELPGVSICHLQRREGIDAVFVSRWAWDGLARLREDDPDRRFAPE